MKRERLARIYSIIEERGIVSVSNIIEELNVSDMTVRRDLDELESMGKLVRFRGGAHSLHYDFDREIPSQKSQPNQEEPSRSNLYRIAEYAASLISEGDTVYLGAGKTLELLASQLLGRKVQVITNSLDVFAVFARGKSAQCILVGGEYNPERQIFAGGLSNRMMSDLNCKIAFITCTGLNNDQISAGSASEGEIQTIALNHSPRRYLLVSSEKFGRQDFYIFYHLYNIDGLITDSALKPDLKEYYGQFVSMIQV